MQDEAIYLKDDYSILNFISSYMVQYDGEKKDTIIPLLYKYNVYYNAGKNVNFFDINIKKSYGYINKENSMCLYLKCELNITDLKKMCYYYGEPINATLEDINSGDFDIVVWDKNVNTNLYVSILPDRWNSKDAFIIILANRKSTFYIESI